MAPAVPFLARDYEDPSGYRDKRRITVVGIVVNILLAVGKIVLGFVGQSQALIADGVHSLSDLFSDALVLVAAKHGSKEADRDHPYGHARIETAVTVIIGLMLLAVAVGMAADAVRRMFDPITLMQPGALALGVAVVSVFAKELLFRYTRRVANRLQSNLLLANAWHHRTDAISSVVVILGVLGTMAGLVYLDAIAAIGVSVMIAKVGWDLAWSSLRELVDTGLDDERVAAIQQVIRETPGVRSVHALKTRRMGGSALVDTKVLVSPELTMSEAHQVSEAVRDRVVGRVDEVTDVMVHIDHEGMGDERVTRRLPLREDVTRLLHARWGSLEGVPQPDQITLHYGRGAIDAHVVFPLETVGSREEADRLRQILEDAVQGIPYIRQVRVYFR